MNYVANDVGEFEISPLHAKDRKERFNAYSNVLDRVNRKNRISYYSKLMADKSKED